jgi:hypothetical protein
MRSLALGRSFRAAGSGPSLAPARRATIGTKVKYSLSEPSTVTFTVERAAAGRKVGRSCRKPTRANASRKRCVRYVALNGSFAHAGTTGANSFRFTGRLANRKLARASYRLVAVAADAAGNRSTARRAAFKIVR